MRSLLSCDPDALPAVCPKERCSYLCGSCGLHHPDVECGGIYFCPSPLCPSAGGAWARHRLASLVQQTPAGSHSVDVVEWVQWAIAHTFAHPELGPDIAAAVARQAAAFVVTNPGIADLVESL